MNSIFSIMEILNNLKHKINVDQKDILFLIHYIETTPLQRIYVPDVTTGSVQIDVSGPNINKLIKQIFSQKEITEIVKKYPELLEHLL